MRKVLGSLSDSAVENKTDSPGESMICLFKLNKRKSFALKTERSFVVCVSRDGRRRSFLHPEGNF